MPILAVIDTAGRPLGELDRLAQHLQDPLGDKLGSYIEPHGVDQHHEFVAAEAPDGVARSKDGIQPRPNSLQDLIRDPAAKAIVELLEAVDAHHQRGDRHMQAPRAGQHLLSSVEDQGPVRQTR